MAKVINVRHLKTHTEFNLSNKPDLLCKIDTEDFYEFVEHRTHWYIHIAVERKNQVTTRPYIRSIWKKGVGHLHLHREVLSLGKFDGVLVGDHITCAETLDNRRSNLRIVTPSESAENRDPWAYQYNGCSVSKFKVNGKTRFQAYRKKRYIASNHCVVQLKEKIDIKIKQLKQQGEI